MNKKYFRFFVLSLIILMLLSSMLAGCQKKLEVTLYFADYEDNRSFLVPETRNILLTDELYKDIINELIKGPSSIDHYPTLPSDVEVIDVTISNNLATVDLGKRIITNFTDIPHGSETELLAIYSIVNTLTEFEEIEKVKITVEGKDEGEIEGLSIQDFWGHVGIYETFSRDESLILK
jgi:spore germination protein GerM